MIIKIRDKEYEIENDSIFYDWIKERVKEKLLKKLDKLIVPKLEQILTYISGEDNVDSRFLQEVLNQRLNKKVTSDNAEAKINSFLDNLAFELSKLYKEVHEPDKVYISQNVLEGAKNNENTPKINYKNLQQCIADAWK